MSWAGVIIVITFAITVAVALFNVSAAKYSLIKNPSTQKAQVSSSHIDLIKRVQFKQYTAPANLIVY